jgi:hypothetical protein
MTDQPYSPRICAAARDTLLDMALMAGVTPRQRTDLVLVAFDILRDARMARLGPRPAPTGPASVTYLTRSELQAGRTPARRRPRLIVLSSQPRTPGDAA